MIIIAQVASPELTYLKSDNGDSDTGGLSKLSVALSVSSPSRNPGSEVSRLEFPVSRPESIESQSDSDPAIISPTEFKE